MVGEPKGDGQDERRGGGDEEEVAPRRWRSISRCMEGLLRWDRLDYARRSRRDLRERSPQRRSVAYARHRARAARAARSAGVVPYGSGRSPRSCAHPSRQRERRRGLRLTPGAGAAARMPVDAWISSMPGVSRAPTARPPSRALWAPTRRARRLDARPGRPSGGDPADTPGDPIAVVVQLAQSGRSPLRYASRLRVAWIVSIGGARCSRQLAIQPSGQAVIADDQCFGTRTRFLPASLLRRKSGGRFDGSAFEQVGSGPFREPGVGAGAGEVDGHLLRQSCDLG